MLIALTLFRSVGWVATDINTRIGDAGPLIYTPEAQCLRTMEFSYGFYAHSGDVEAANVLKRADEFNSQTLLVETNKHSGNLPLESSFFNIESDNNEVILSSFKLSEDKTSLIIRVYNGSTKTTNATFRLAQQIKKAEIVNLIEDKIKNLDFDTNTIKMEIGAKSIETLKLMVKREECAKPLNSDIECWLIDDKEIIDLSEYERYPLVTEEEVKKEEERAKNMESGLDDVLTRRTSLEAKLSSILAHDRLNESITHSLGYQLNEARVKRRVHDYIQDLK